MINTIVLRNLSNWQCKTLVYKMYTSLAFYRTFFYVVRLEINIIASLFHSVVGRNFVYSQGPRFAPVTIRRYYYKNSKYEFFY